MNIKIIIFLNIDRIFIITHATDHQAHFAVQDPQQAFADPQSSILALRLVKRIGCLPQVLHHMDDIEDQDQSGEDALHFLGHLLNNGVFAMLQARPQSPAFRSWSRLVGTGQIRVHQVGDDIFGRAQVRFRGVHRGHCGHPHRRGHAAPSCTVLLERVGVLALRQDQRLVQWKDALVVALMSPPVAQYDRLSVIFHVSTVLCYKVLFLCCFMSSERICAQKK